MDLKQFEDNINRKFEDFEPEVDSLKIWDNIEEKLPTKSKARYGLWFSLMLIPILAYFAYSTMIAKDADLSTQMDDTETIISQVLEEEAAQISDPIVSEENKMILEAEERTTNNAVSNRIERQKSSNQAKEITGNVPVRASINPRMNNTALPVPTFAEAKNTERVNTNNSNNLDSSLQKGQDNIKLANQNIPSSDVSLSNTQLSNELAQDSGTKVQDAIDEKLTEDFELSSSSLEVNKDNQITQQEDKSAEIIDDEFEKKENEISKPIQDFAVDKINEVKVLEKRLSISLLGGILATNRKYEAGIEEADVLAIAEKETAEQQLETLQFEALLRYRITPKISVGVGLRNWRLSEKSNYTTESTTEDFVDVATGYIHHPDNTVETMFSSVPITYYETVTNTRFQSHQSWSIPMRLYVSMINTEKFEFEIGGGYEFSFSAKHIGYELEGNKTEYLMTLDEDNRYKNSGGDFLLLDINTNYKLKNSLALTAGLEGKYGLNGFNTETARFKKKYHFFGLYTGLTYSF